MNDFEKFEEELPSKEKFYSSLADRKISGIESMISPIRIDDFSKIFDNNLVAKSESKLTLRLNKPT